MRFSTSLVAGLVLAAPAFAQEEANKVVSFACVSEGQYSYNVIYAPSDPGFVDVDRFKTSSGEEGSTSTGTLVSDVDATGGLLSGTTEELGIGNGDIQSTTYVLTATAEGGSNYVDDDSTLSFEMSDSGSTLTELVAAQGSTAYVVDCEIAEESEVGKPDNVVILDMAGTSLGASIFAGPDPNSAVLAELVPETPIQVVMDSGIEMDDYHWFQVQYAGMTAYHWGGYMCVPGMVISGASGC